MKRDIIDRILEFVWNAQTEAKRRSLDGNVPAVLITNAQYAEFKIATTKDPDKLIVRGSPWDRRYDGPDLIFGIPLIASGESWGAPSSWLDLRESL